MSIETTMWRADFLNKTILEAQAHVVNGIEKQEIHYRIPADYPSHMGSMIRRTEAVVSPHYVWCSSLQAACTSLLVNIQEAINVAQYGLSQAQAAWDAAVIYTENLINPPPVPPVVIPDPDGPGTLPLSPLNVEDSFFRRPGDLFIPNTSDPLYEPLDMRYYPRPPTAFVLLPVTLNEQEQ